MIHDADDDVFELRQIATDEGRFLEVGDGDRALDRRRLTGDYPATFWLRLTQIDGTVIASASPDGMNWTPVGRPGDVSSFTAPQIGLAARTDDDDFVTTAAFDWFHLTEAAAGKDRTPPTIVAATADGLRTSTGEFLNSATVALTATDLGAGVETVEYAIGDRSVRAATRLRSRRPARCTTARPTRPATCRRPAR